VWTLFDGGTAAGQIDAAQAGIDRAKLTLQQLRTDVELQVRQAVLNLSDAKARVGAAQAYVALADENLRLAQVRYRGGVGTVLELQDAQLRATSARQALIAAQVAVREGIVHVRFAAGLL
jgi:outer membrane protein TolC